MFVMIFDYYILCLIKNYIDKFVEFGGFVYNGNFIDKIIM